MEHEYTLKADNLRVEVVGTTGSAVVIEVSLWAGDAKRWIWKLPALKVGDEAIIGRPGEGLCIQLPVGLSTGWDARSLGFPSDELVEEIRVVLEDK